MGKIEIKYEKTPVTEEEVREDVLDLITEMLEEISPDDNFSNALKVLKAHRKLEKLSREIVDLCGTPQAPRVDVAIKAHEALSEAVSCLKKFVDEM